MFEQGQNPADLCDLANNLLNEAGFGSTLMDPETARKLAPIASDVALKEADIKAGETMFLNAAVENISLRDSLIAPLVKLVSRRRSRKVRHEHEARSRQATRERGEALREIRDSGKVPLTWHSRDRTFPSYRGVPLTPLEMLWESGPRAVSLNPYQVQASGVIEVVRAAGWVLGCRDGDWLADQYMRMIIDLSGRESDGADWERGAACLAGGIFRAADKTHIEPPEWTPLDGRRQLLAVTVLASWMRMSRLGVSMGRKNRLQSWLHFYDGVSYGVRPQWLGEIWVDRDRTYPEHELSEPWRTSKEYPWFLRSEGAPLPAVGVAGELLKMAITKVQALGTVPDDFDLDGDEEIAPSYVMSERVLIHLKRMYQEIAGSPVGSIISIPHPDD